MKRTIRCGVFETNSSSVHSLSFCTDDEWNDWRDGKTVWDRWEHEFIPVTLEIEQKMERDKYSPYYTMDDFFSWGRMDYETFDKEYTTKNGEVIHAFGYFGHD